MKTLIALLVVLVVGTVEAQEWLKLKDAGKTSLNVSTPPAIQFHSTSGKYFRLSFSGDSLIASGELTPDSAAGIFIREVVERYSILVRSLRDSLHQMRQKARLREMQRLSDEIVKKIDFSLREVGRKGVRSKCHYPTK